MDRSQLELDLSIDKNNLDAAWVAHPALVFDYSEKTVEAEQNLERIELKQDITIAQLDAEARVSGEKMTEARVKNWVILHSDYQAVEEERIQAKYEVGILKAAVKALDTKRKGLEKLVDLYLSSYFSEPKHSYSEAAVSNQVHAALAKTMQDRENI
jgi:hypothetical protein